MGKFRTFRELKGDEKLAAFEAAFLLLAARGLVTFVPLRYWRGRFGTVRQAGALHDPDREHASNIVRRAIGRAMRNAPLDFICLPQALAGRWMLARRGHDSELSIGARRDERGQLDIHAWLTCGGHWVTGDCDPDEFSPFTAA